MPKSIRPVVVIPNINGSQRLKACLDSLLSQTVTPHIIVVDNGSTDDSVAKVLEHPEIELIRHPDNRGYAGGVNPGFQRAIEMGASYVAPFNNDAVADERWLELLIRKLDSTPETGIAAPKLLNGAKNALDSTGEGYSAWGLPFPRGRDETELDKYDSETEIFGASGGASLYRVSMLTEIGLLDEDFFAYYEDVDLSFRAQWAGWKVSYVPESLVFHHTSSTSKLMKGTGKKGLASTTSARNVANTPTNEFFTYQTMKNLPMLLWKNVPVGLLPVVLPRFTLAYATFFAAAIQRRQLGFALRGAGRSLAWLPKKLGERRRIMKTAKVSPEYIASIITYDLPPNARRLRKLRSYFRRQGLAHDKADDSKPTSAGDR